MAVTVSFALFGNPGHELEEGAVIKGQQLRDLAADLQTRLEGAAATVDQLTAGGWSAQVAMFDLLLSHPAVQTEAEAVTRLQVLGLDPENFMILEDVEDEEDE